MKRGIPSKIVQESITEVIKWSGFSNNLVFHRSFKNDLHNYSW
jgi:AraC-like DNA-binding protein